MLKAIRVFRFPLPIVFARFSVARKPAVVGTFSISPYGLA